MRRDTDDHNAVRLTAVVAGQSVCRLLAPRTAQRQAAALAELAHITAGRTDLLARYAGQSLSLHDIKPEDSVHLSAAQLCITAGADMDLIERWRHESHPAAEPESGRRLRRYRYDR